MQALMFKKSGLGILSQEMASSSVNLSLIKDSNFNNREEKS